MDIKFQKNRAFTVVELMVVIVVIGIIAAVLVTGYGSWQSSVAKNAVQSDLKMAASAMKNAKNFSNGYPTSIPSTFRGSSKVNLSVAWSTGTSFCLNGVSVQYGSVQYYLDSSGSDEPKAGTCSSVGLPTPTLARGAITTSSIVVSWGNVVGATSYVVRYGTSTPTSVASCTTSPCTISGLTQNTEYKINVTAQFSSGSSVSNIVTATTNATAPNIPTQYAGSDYPQGMYINPDDPGFTITWGRPSGGSPVTGYRVQVECYSTTYDIELGVQSASGATFTYTANAHGFIYQADWPIEGCDGRYGGGISDVNVAAINSQAYGPDLILYVEYTYWN